VQFFDNELIAIANELAVRGLRVIIAGLDQDYTRKALGADAATTRRRGIHHQDPCDLHEVRPARELHSENT
jgi:hypothetical protein